MGLSALEKIQEIQAKADQEIKELKQQAVSEIVRRLAEAKELIRDLEVQYTALTGKNLKGETVVDQKNGIGKRDFSSVEQLATVLATPGDKKLNRKGLSDAGYSLKSAIKVARNNPAVFGFKQNGPQGEVWLK